MKKIKISVATLMSVMLVTSSLMSCSTDDKGSNSNDVRTAKSVSSTTSASDWYTFVQDNAQTLNRQFRNGMTQSELDVMLVSLGYSSGDLSITQFNEIYSELLSQNDVTKFDDMYNKYYGDKPAFFTKTFKAALNNESIDDSIASAEWNDLSREDQNLILGVSKLVQVFPVEEDASARRGGYILFGGTINVSDEVGVIVFYTIVGAGVGSFIGGPVGGAIGAVAGAVVGVVMAAIK